MLDRIVCLRVFVVVIVVSSVHEMRWDCEVDELELEDRHERACEQGELPQIPRTLKRRGISTRL